MEPLVIGIVIEPALKARLIYTVETPIKDLSRRKITSDTLPGPKSSFSHNYFEPQKTKLLGLTCPLFKF